MGRGGVLLCCIDVCVDVAGGGEGAFDRSIIIRKDKVGAAVRGLLLLKNNAKLLFALIPSWVDRVRCTAWASAFAGGVGETVLSGPTPDRAALLFSSLVPLLFSVIQI